MLLRRAKRSGLPVTCEVAPHHFALTDHDVGDYRTFAKMAPPLRSETNRRAMVEGLKDGTIDAIASDHAPHDQESKRVPMERAANGIVGLETMLPLSLELYHGGHLSLRDVLRRLTSAPADLLGLDAGRLRRGAPADLVLFDLDAPWRVDRSVFRSKSSNTPFDGRPVQGRVLRTVVDGRTVFATGGLAVGGGAVSYADIATACLRRLPPETAHNAALALLGLGRLPAPPQPAPALATDALGAALPDARGARRRLRQGCPMPRRSGTARPRLRRGGHGDTVAAAGEPQAPPVPPAAGPCADKPVWLQQCWPGYSREAAGAVAPRE